MLAVRGTLPRVRRAVGVAPVYDQIFRFFTSLPAPTLAASSIASSAGRSWPLRGSLASGMPPVRLHRRLGARVDGIARSTGAGRLSRAYSTQQCPDCPNKPAVAPTLPTPLSNSNKHPTYLNSLPLSLRRLAAALPTPIGRPPSQEQVLSLTTSFFERLKIRFKWATIRSYRRFRVDDYSAFFSVGIAGTLTWFLISTTSFLAFVFAIFNSLSLQEWTARKLGDYLTKHTGVTVVFESAIVPRWGVAGGGSKIVFKNVYISRGPTEGKLGVLPPVEAGDREEETEAELSEKEILAKWTHFHLSIDTVEVSLSLSRWLDGNGLVREASVTGVRGVVDRSHIVWDPDAPLDRYAYRHVARPGDFWLEKLQIQDFLVTIYQPDNFRPYTFSIFNADIKKFRKQWLFYDLMSADSITGQVDNCLFSLHKPQSIGRTSEEDLKDARWARMSRFRIDGVPIDHMQTAHDSGVLSWVTSGRCDLVADIRFPSESLATENELSLLVADFVEKIDKEISTHLHVGTYDTNAYRDRIERDTGSNRIPGQRVLKGDALEVPKGWDNGRTMLKKPIKFSEKELENDELKGWRKNEESLLLEVKEAMEERKVSIDIDIRFKDLKASVPIFTPNLSYVNNALVRPIVAFLNSNKTLIPIRCHFDLSLDDFDGSWTTYDCGILDRTSEQVYAALAHHVQSASGQRIQAVSLWTLRLTAEAVLSTFKKSFGEGEKSGMFL